MQHYLNYLFLPKSIAVIGASNRPKSVGTKVFKNLKQAGFAGGLFPVNPKHRSVQGIPCFSKITDIDEKIDLVIITAPAKAVPEIMRACGKKQIPAAIVISAGFSETGKAGKALENEVLDIANQYNIRFIGPNCLGIMRPAINMNASFDNNTAKPGNIALISQSGALSAGILDWAMEKDIGFSALVSLGNAANIDFGDILEYLALDPHTKHILLYVEGVHNSRRFMQALRTAARLKPVIAIKSGRHPQGQRAAVSHTGALIGDDDVFDAALKRAGAVRVLSIDELFSAAEILSANKTIQGNRLAIITNGGGAGVMAADRVSDTNATLAKLDSDTISQLSKVLPAHWSHGNPIDIIGDAPPERYHQAIALCEKNNDIDAILTILVPVEMSKPADVAKKLIQDAKDSEKPIIACWIGEKHVKSSWRLFAENNIPYFDTPEKAVQAFSYLADYTQNQLLLRQVNVPRQAEPNLRINQAKDIIQTALKNKQTLLSQTESKRILAAFHINTVTPILCETEKAAVEAAIKCGFPVAMKIDADDITHKSDIGGVKLNIKTESDVQTAFSQIISNAKNAHPNAKINGVTVEHMLVSPNNRELMIGIKRDKIFGPIISFGIGGIFVELISDRALALPPLNRFIAKNLIAKSRAAKLLAPFRHMQAIDLDKIIHALLRVSDLACEIPQIKEMDINPLIINETDCTVVDARIVIDEIKAEKASPYDHLAIPPYPIHLITHWKTKKDRSITIRPIRPNDTELVQAITTVHHKKKTKSFDFINSFYELSDAMFVRFTQIDYDREMVLIAIHKSNGQKTIVGVSRYIANDTDQPGAFTLVIADQWQDQGIGRKLFTSLIDIAKSKGIPKLEGIVQKKNKPMIHLCQCFGFELTPSDDRNLLTATLQLSNQGEK